MQGQTYTLDDLKLRLEEIHLTAPTQPLVVVPEDKATHTEVKKIVALCLAAKLTQVTIAKAVPPTAPAVASGATPASLPTPSSDAHAGAASTVASASNSSAAMASLSATNGAPNPPRLSKPHATTIGAPISTGPNYTVP